MGMALSSSAAASLRSNPFDLELLQAQVAADLEAFDPDEERDPHGRWVRGMPEQGELFEKYQQKQSDRIAQVLKRAAADKRVAQAAQEAATRGDARNDPGVTTDGQHYTPQTDDFNKRVAESFLDPKAKVPEGKQPIAVFMLGKPGAGKSAMMGSLRDKLPPMVNINADDVMDKLPGYKGTLAQAYHEWGCDVARHYLTPEALTGHYNVNFDMTDNVSRLERTAQECKLMGYRIVVLHADVDTATSVERAYNRFVVKGRYVPLDVVKSYGERPKQAYDHIKASGIADEWREYDTTDAGLGRARGGAPVRARLVESGYRTPGPVLIGAERSLGTGAGRGRSHRLSRLVQETSRAKVALLQAANELGVLAYSDDEARDAHGEWTRGDSVEDSYQVLGELGKRGKSAALITGTGKIGIGDSHPHVANSLGYGDKNDPFGVDWDRFYADGGVLVRYRPYNVDVSFGSPNEEDMDRVRSILDAVPNSDGNHYTMDYFQPGADGRFAMGDKQNVLRAMNRWQRGLAGAGVQAYSEDEERDDHGRWTSGMDANLKALSRTAKGEERHSDRPGLAKSGQELADKATDNFHKAAEWVWQNRELEMDRSNLPYIVTKIGDMVNEGLLKPGQSLWRNYEDPKLHYPPASEIKGLMQNFYSELADRIKSGDDPKGIAAWAEHEFNVKIHPFSDGMGRATQLLSGMILLQKGHDLPKYEGRDSFYKNMTGPDWEKYYRGLFGVEAYSPDEERDSHGEWTSGGIVYHGTSSAALKQIAKEGLIPGKGQGGDAWARKFGRERGMGSAPAEMLGRAKSIFFTRDRINMVNFAAAAAEVNKGSLPVILKVNLPADVAKKMKQDEFSGPGNWRYTHTIPAKYITAYRPATKFEGGYFPPAEGTTWGKWKKFDPSQLAASGTVTFYTFILCHPGLEAYSPDEARDAHGRWGNSGDAPEKWIGFDLDGTLAHYEHWEGPGKIGAPLKDTEVWKALEDHLAAGDHVKIMTARVAHDPGGVERKAIQAWCKKRIGRVLPITSVKDQGLTKLYDDRAVAVAKNSGKLLNDPTKIKARAVEKTGCVACERGDCEMHGYSPDEERNAHGEWSQGGDEEKDLTPQQTEQEMLNLYHGTASDALRSIAREGLVPGKGQGGDAAAIAAGLHGIAVHSLIARPKSTYFTTSERDAKFFAMIAAAVNPGSKPVVLQVRVPRALADTFKADELNKLDGVALRDEKPLPPKYIAAYQTPPMEWTPSGSSIEQIVNRWNSSWKRFSPSVFAAADGYVTYYSFILHHPGDVEAYSDDEERDERGRWVKVGSELFVSPNTGESTLDEALSEMNSDRQKSFIGLSNRVVGAVARSSAVHSAIGVWADGAETSASIDLPKSVDADTSRYIGALLAKAAAQKAYLNFVRDPQGSNLLYECKTGDDLGTINKKLTAAGIGFHTMIPGGGGTEVRVFDADGSQAAKMESFAKDNDLHVEVSRGTGTFVGSEESREEGANEYDQIIQRYEREHPDKAYRDSLQFRGCDEQGRNRGDCGRSAYAQEEIFTLDLGALEERIHAAISTAEVVRRIRGLRTVPEPKGKWSTMRRAKQRRYNTASVWKENPMTRIDKPADAEAFKRLPVKIRDHIVDTAPLRTFNPKDLKSNQPAVYQADLEHFAHHGHDPEPVIVLKTRVGLYVHNGNHRATVAMLSGRRIKARYVDLSKVKEIQAMIPIIDGMLEARNIFAPEESAGRRLSLAVNLAVEQ